MTTEAQINANRINAQTSTGPRTPEGKEKAAQNALKHGLLAKDAVIIGEDLDDFDLLCTELRAELAPVGLAESLLVERIVGAFWRLQRAERFQTAAFDMTYVQCNSDPQNQRWRSAPKPEGTDPIFGLAVLKDFSQTRTLERVVLCEQRIESGLYRTMAQLRQVQGQRQGAAGGPIVEDDRRGRRSHMVRGTHPAELSRAVQDRGARFRRVRETRRPDFTLEDLLAKIAASEEEPQTREDALGNPDEPAGGTTNTPVAEGQSCDNASLPGVVAATNPISPRSTSILPVNEDHRQVRPEPCERDADATIPPDGGTTNTPEAQSELCETNPIPPAQTGPEGHGTAAIVPNEPNVGSESRQTKPISTAAAIEVSVENGTGTFSEAEKEPVPGDSRIPSSQQICETKPIAAGAQRKPFGYTPIFRRHR